MKRQFIIILLACLPLFVAAGQNVDVRLETRAAFAVMPDDSGFQGDYFNVRINGSINDLFSYSFHHRLNKPISNRNLFNATDWAWVKFDNGKWGVQAGKMQLEYGGFEFDTPVIDLYSTSEYYDRFNGAFTFGLNLIRHFKISTLMVQVAQSAFSESALGGLHSYSISYRGACGWYEWIHSINSFDVPDGSPLASLVLGNRFSAGPAKFELDLLQRANFNSWAWFDDVSVIAKANVAATDWMDVIAKFAYDYNGGQNDPLVPQGIRFYSYEAGFQFFPVKESRDVRIHCLYQYFHCPTFLAGVTWKIHILTK